MPAAGGRVYDVCVVGAGMIGSAAARHASETPGARVCLVGPGEPQDRMNRTIFGAHYDEGRITRVLDPDPTWALLAQRSIRRYRELERKTGINFFHDVGYLVIGSPDGDYVRSVQENARDNDVTTQTFSRAQTRERFPFLDIGAGMVGLLDSRNCGHLSPRRLVSALQTAAHLQGCDVVDDVVASVEPPASWARSAGANLAVRTETGGVIHARRVLLATGAFTTFRRLLPAALRPDVRLTGQTVSLVEISESDADLLQRMPSMIYRHPTDLGRWFYILPPIGYPDGKFYMKIGHGVRWEALLHTEGQVRDWYRSGGVPEAVSVMTSELLELVTGVKPISVHGDACVTVKTPTEQLYVDMVTPSLGVALGGNGWAAKSCDEIGRMAAKMILKGQWDYDLPRDQFRVRWAEIQLKSKL
ncbi:PIPOX [Branchiostoma lanceolatum]|uniref:PIPOX protein n=1 Tax=Branchiostoma lanceolatum TaxID=7740 RepID=A0A8J9ZLB6_BRALA|nr:PIPOX [Branchiostoma lanceolatum]